jgi:phospholipase/carboxylesterase
MVNNHYIQKPLSDGQPKQIVVLLHGYGSNGQDLISLAPYFAPSLPDAVFISPDAPFPCELGMGFQWFSLGRTLDNAGTPLRDLSLYEEGTKEAHPILDNYLDKLLADHELTADKMMLVGFSQGTMMSLYTGLRKNLTLAGVLGYSGAMVGAEALDNQNKLPIRLIHGENDSVVPVEAYHDARQKLLDKGYNVSGHTSPNLEHSIDEKGIKSGAEFISKCFN